MLKIDKTKTYPIENLEFKNYINLTSEESHEVLTCRNHAEIRKWMYNDDIIKLDDHLKFIEKLRKNNESFYWAAYQGSSYIGSINITHICTDTQTATWGYYLNPIYIGGGKGLDIEYCALKLFFNSLGLKEVNGEINRLNNPALKLHSIFGYSSEPSDKPDYIKVNLDAQKWSELPETLAEFKRYIIVKLKNR